MSERAWYERPLAWMDDVASRGFAPAFLLFGGLGLAVALLTIAVVSS